MCLKFGFVIFRQKDFGAKAAHKMLVKLTPGVSVTEKKSFIALAPVASTALSLARKD